MKRTKLLLAMMGFFVFGSTQTAQAAAPNGVASGPFVACFYECVLDSTLRLWKEVTGLVIPNPSGGANAYNAHLLFFDGNENFLARGETFLSPFDLDTVNVCETLDQADIPVPASGVVYIVHDLVANNGNGDGFTPAPGWVKNYLGSFIRVRTASRTLDPDTLVEPHKGKLISIGKTGCRLIWGDTEELEVGGDSIDLILIEETQDLNVL